MAPARALAADGSDKCRPLCTPFGCMAIHTDEDIHHCPRLHLPLGPRVRTATGPRAALRLAPAVTSAAAARVDPVAAQQCMEVRPLHSRALRRLGDVVAAAIERPTESLLQLVADHLPLDLQLLPRAGQLPLADTDALASRTSQGRRPSSIREPPARPRVRRCSSKLADVAGPGIQLQLVHRFGKTDHVDNPSAQCWRKAAAGGNVPVAIAARREPNRHDIQTVVEIGAERPALTSSASCDCSWRSVGYRPRVRPYRPPCAPDASPGTRSNFPWVSRLGFALHRGTSVPW